MKRRVGSVSALVVAVLALVAATATVLTGRYVADLSAQRDVAARAADDVTVVMSALRSRSDAVEALVAAGHPNGGPVPEPFPEPSGVARVTARDSGAPVLDDAAGGMVVAAVYDGAAVPTTVQERRDRVAGYVVAALDLGGLVRDLAPAGGAISVDGPDERVVSSAEVAPASGVSHTVSFRPDGVSRWSLTVTAPTGEVPVMAWLLTLVILLSGAATSTWIAVRQRVARRNRDELAGLQRSNAAVTALALVSQQTLELGEVLPAMTTELSTSLGLKGLTVTTLEAGAERALFTWGRPPGSGPLVSGLDEVAAGEAVWVRLSRGGRMAARLGAVAGRDLDRHDVATLAAAGEVMAAALTNADAYAEQQGLLDRMREVDELKSVFLSTASHELRTPVVAIAGYANVLHENWDVLGPEKARGLVDRVDRNAQQLSRMVEDLLDFSRLEQGAPSGEAQQLLDLSDVIGEVLGDQPDLGEHHEVSYHPTAGLTVRGSRQVLDRVVVNLVGNAVKYTPDGTPIRVIVQQRDDHDDQAELVVEDDGAGIAAEERDKVFSRFYRGRGDEVTRTRGTGLGLAIVAEFALTMGGAARVEESASGGARFVITFPLAAPAPAPAPPAPQRSTAVSDPTPSVSRPGGPS